MIQVLFFGPLAEVAGTNDLQLEHTGDLNALRAELVRRFPPLADKQFAIALNTALVRENVSLPLNSTVALLPHFQEDK